MNSPIASWIELSKMEGLSSGRISCRGAAQRRTLQRPVCLLPGRSPGDLTNVQKRLSASSRCGERDSQRHLHMLFMLRSSACAQHRPAMHLYRRTLSALLDFPHSLTIYCLPHCKTWSVSTCTGPLTGECVRLQHMFSQSALAATLRYFGQI